MAETRVIIKSFQDFILMVTPFENTMVRKKEFDDFIIIVPASGIPSNALLNEDSTPILTEDSEFIEV